jgi:hypothetical protein
MGNDAQRNHSAAATGSLGPQRAVSVRGRAGWIPLHLPLGGDLIDPAFLSEGGHAQRLPASSITGLGVWAVHPLRDCDDMRT